MKVDRGNRVDIKMKQPLVKNQKGYTLVELSMVLIILGLVVGGLIKGSEWIDNAKLKSVINSFEHITQAHYTYIKRTGEFPGLPRDASGNVTGSNWGGDLYFEDLISEGLMPAPESGGSTVTHAFHGSWVVSSTDSLFDGAQICAEGIPMFAAAGMDERLDDGIADTGRLITRVGETFTSSTVLTAYAAEETLTTVCKRL